MQEDPKVLSKSKEKGESKKKKKQKEKKEKHENFMKDLPPSCFSCVTHPEEYLRIFPKHNKSPPTCKSCGFKLEGKYNYLACIKTSTCFQLCSSCKICTQNHILRQMPGLTHLTSNPLYAENKFTCHGCKKEQKVGAKGVWQCIPCSFSICSQCIQATDKLWESNDQDE